jgi:diaminopimelate decarboxylase
LNRELSWTELMAASERVGPTFYLADVERFVASCGRLLDAFRARYPRTSIAYSYKTNYLPAFIRAADSLGAWSEVVSAFEYDFAIGLGIPPERILVNGPIKGAEDLIRMIVDGARVHVDSPAEIETLLSLTDLGAGKGAIPIGLRCHLGDNTPGSRFGIDLGSDEGAAALQALDAAPQFRVAALHAHHSADRAAEVYRARAEALVGLHHDILGGRSLEYIDVGGGLASDMEPELVAQMPAAPPSFEDYAEAVAGTFRAAYGSGGPALILEPGIGLVSDAMVFVAKVELLKEIGGARYAVVDGSVFNIKPLRHGINLPLRVVSAPGNSGREGPWDVVGFTCMEKGVDLLHSGCTSSMAPGDFVVVRNIGAYSIVLNAPFIRGTPPILEVKDGRPGRVLRRASTATDLLESYREP